MAPMLWLPYMIMLTITLIFVVAHMYSLIISKPNNNTMYQYPMKKNWKW
nr:ATP synthase F0 subunit 8 [Ichthyoxenos japonensis]ATO58522.1 ATP synthase F0 subunit 8 [Ichthyoxenos japonensis]